MELQLSQSQQHILSQQMRQSVEILQMNSLELGEYLKRLANENPVVELDDGWKEPPAGLQPLREEKLRWLYSLDDDSHLRRVTPTPDDDVPDISFYADQPEDGLEDVLNRQISGFSLRPEQERALRYLIGNLDENGYLTLSVEQAAADLQLSAEDAGAALSVLHQMEPCGLGARDLRECLLLQLKGRSGAGRVAERIVRDHLELLARNQLDRLARALGAPLETVKQARDLICSLNPKPGNGFSAKTPAPYVSPDLLIVHFADHYEILLNDYGQPRLQISAGYRQLAAQPDADPQTAAYLDEKLRQAEWVLRCISQRQNTLMGCAQVILEKQEAFFRLGPGHGAPMSLGDVAAQLEVHPSTVSRTVRGKYLQCQWGLFPLSNFFTRAVGGAEEQNTRESICGIIRLLISREDRQKPLSDQRIAELLADQGIEISRRTVAKYRDQLNILPASGRRAF